MTPPSGGATWEYACVMVMQSTREITKADPEYRLLSGHERTLWDKNNWHSYQWQDQTAYIWLPEDQEPTERILWHPFEEGSILVVDLLNELGAEGWELTAIEQRDIAMSNSAGTLGWYPYSKPVQTHYYLKRQRARVASPAKRAVKPR